MAVGFAFVASAHALDFAEEGGREPLDAAFKAEAVDFFAQGCVGDIAGDKEEDCAFVKGGELAQRFEGFADAGVTEPEDAGCFAERAP